mmetsp:Transcript_36615/g.101665  ORF Transcript_36615/g.101665 Transcript_36615/m.101665 type:complete len:378 (-) Transcript_36615:137-1270(-)
MPGPVHKSTRPGSCLAVNGNLAHGVRGHGRAKRLWDGLQAEYGVDRGSQLPGLGEAPEDVELAPIPLAEDVAVLRDRRPRGARGGVGQGRVLDGDEAAAILEDPVRIVPSAGQADAVVYQVDRPCRDHLPPVGGVVVDDLIRAEVPYKFKVGRTGRGDDLRGPKCLGQLDAGGPRAAAATQDDHRGPGRPGRAGPLQPFQAGERDQGQDARLLHGQPGRLPAGGGAVDRGVLRVGSLAHAPDLVARAQVAAEPNALHGSGKVEAHGLRVRNAEVVVQQNLPVHRVHRGVRHTNHGLAKPCPRPWPGQYLDALLVQAAISLCHGLDCGRHTLVRDSERARVVVGPGHHGRLHCRRRRRRHVLAAHHLCIELQQREFSV